jgi:hypothetical protein
MSAIRRHVAVAAIFSVLLGPASGIAATVSQESGTVLINRGAGFSPAGADAELVPGTQILVQPGSQALIRYADSCVVKVGAGVWMVQAAAPCAAGNTFIDFTGRMNQGADTSGSGPLLGVPIEIPLLGGALIGISIAVFNQKDKGASP